MKRAVVALTILGTAMLAAFSAPAKAMEPEKWQGLYAGFQSGYVAGADTDWTDSVFGPADVDIDGFLNGLVAGYNHRSGQILFGVEVDGAIVDAGDDPTPCAAIPTCRIDWNNLLTFRGRLGWIFGDQDQFAVYATGGYAVSGWDANGGAAGVAQFVLDGWVIGGGAEAYLLNTNWLSTKVEYNYIDFSGGETYSTGSVTSATFDTDAHIVKFGLNVHF